MLNQHMISGEFNNLQKYKKKYQNQYIIIKFGGALAESSEIITNIVTQAAFLHQELNAKVVLVHGGGNQITDCLKAHGIGEKKDTNGLRDTDLKTLEISDKVLQSLNTNICDLFREAVKGIAPLGIAGYDLQLISASPTSAVTGNYTGHIDTVNVKALEQILTLGSTIPVIYPICYNPNTTDENRLNVNADEVTSALASHLNARRLILCSDIPGVMDSHKNVITQIDTNQITKLIDNGTVKGGMIQKLINAGHAAQKMTSGGVVILDGRKPNSIIQEFVSDTGDGTLIKHNPT